MKNHGVTVKRSLLAALLAVLFLPCGTRAHCDTLDGPVVADARKALESGKVEIALKWVRPQDEAEVRAAFRQARTVRSLNAEAKELADRYFFETLVRLHRTGEGAPYTGLKPAGTEIDPGLRAADQAIATGSVSALSAQMSEDVAAGIQKRFAALMQKKKDAEQSVVQGREYVAAYVEFIHFVESLRATATEAVVEPRPDGTHKH